MTWRRRRRVTQETAVPPQRRPLIWPWLALLLLLVAALIAAAVLLTRKDDTPHVPNVVGQGTAQAVDELGRRGYAADVETTIRPSAQPGKVLSQAPAAGTKLDKGSRVTIVSARGRTIVGVPDVVGLSAPKAFARLQAAGLKGKTNPVSSKQPRGTVLSQSPAAEGRAKKGSFVLLTISSGRATVTVPRVIGLSEAQATARLTPLGFRARVTRIPSTKTEGLVISQVPAQGTRAKKGSVVGLNVSDGPPTTTTNTTTTTTTTTTATTPPNPGGAKVPKVTGMGQAQAIARLQSAGFRVDSYPLASSRPRGLVVSQRPTGGARVPAKSLIRVNVSLGPGERPLRVVPDVVGKTEAQAKQVLAQVGFTVRTVSQATETSAAGTVVVDQKPAAESRKPAGAQVLIYLGSG